VRSPDRRGRARAWLLLVGLLALPVAGGAAPAQHPRVALTSQSAWVQAGGAFQLGLHVDGARDATALELALSTYARVPSRSAFGLTVEGRTSGSLIDVTTTPLTDLGLDQAGNLAASLPIQDPAAPRDPSRLLLAHEGVYPVRVELREKGGGTVFDRFTTHLVYLPATRTGPKLDVAWVLQAHAPPALQPDGSRHLSSARDLLTVGQALEAMPAVPVSVAPTPETMEALTTSSSDAAGDALASLRRVLPHHEVVAGPYVPANLPSLIAGGIQPEADAEVRRGAERLGQALRAPVDDTTFLSEEPLDEASIARLRDLGVDKLALPENSLTPLQSRLTLARPFLVDAKQGRRVAAVSLDPGLAAHFSNTGNQVLAAHQFLADLAVLYFDQPGGSTRSVVALTPRAWHPSRGFLDAALGGLADSPVVQPVTLGSVFDSVEKLRVGNAALVRRPVSAARTAPAGAAKTARQRLATYGSIVDPGNPVYDGLQEQLLVAHSADLRSSRQRAYVTGVERGVGRQLSRIQTPAGSITLTARGGQIPVTFQNSTGYPVHVVVTVRSDKLEFPGGTARDGSSIPNEVSRKLDLVRRNETTRFAVLTRASGAFPIQITMESPDGSLVVSKTRLTVRSTAAPGLGLFLSAAAGLFLLVWWGRHALHGRRARRLVPV
jgi:hypothetical protein